MRTTFGEGLGARPLSAESNIGDIFVDTTTNTRYTFDDGKWLTTPVREEPEIPTPTTADNGKILKVAEGKWAMGVDSDNLPEVTTADNGKILEVVDGKWDKGSHQSLSAYRTSSAQDTIDATKQATLVSGTNIKTVNNQSILGSGNITISGDISYEEI